MDRENIIRMAREAGIGPVYGYESIERFAALVAAVERNACAKVCEDRERANLYGVKECAAAIRARSKQ
jgi:hypothetical protein